MSKKGGNGGDRIDTFSIDDPDDDIVHGEQIETSIKIRRGMSRRSLDLIEAMYSITKAAQPITGRGVGYKLFTAGLIPSMSRTDMQRVYRLLKEARERTIIPWRWIVDEARQFERTPSWDDPRAFAQAAAAQYRLDNWKQQPERCEVWSEKGTVRGVLQPVLDAYGVGFRVMHGFASATVAHDIAADRDKRPLTAVYVGDWDPSGLYMSERDLPARLDEYGGDHVEVVRIALRRSQLAGLPSFPASEKTKDPRYKWFIENFGDQCWEIDALDPNQLRASVKEYIDLCIGDPAAWLRNEVTTEAQRETLETVLNSWAKP
jgi:hypothetical protein